MVLVAIALSAVSVQVRAQSLTLPDWMHSSQRDLPPEVFPTRTPAPPAPVPASPAPTAPSVPGAGHAERLFAFVICAVGPSCQLASRTVVSSSQAGPEADILTKL